MGKARTILGVTVLVLLLAVRAASALVPAHCGPAVAGPAAAFPANP